MRWDRVTFRDATTNNKRVTTWFDNAAATRTSGVLVYSRVCPFTDTYRWTGPPIFRTTRLAAHHLSDTIPREIYHREKRNFTDKNEPSVETLGFKFVKPVWQWRMESVFLLRPPPGVTLRYRFLPGGGVTTPTARSTTRLADRFYGSLI